MNPTGSTRILAIAACLVAGFLPACNSNHKPNEAPRSIGSNALDPEVRRSTREEESGGANPLSPQQVSNGTVTTPPANSKVTEKSRGTRDDRQSQPLSVTTASGLGYGGEDRAVGRSQYAPPPPPVDVDAESPSGDGYVATAENQFVDSKQTRLSTFSIDVDAASYSNVRRFVSSGSRPPAAAVRIEEMINYFSYDYPQPEGSDPFSITTETAACPWNRDHRLVMIGLQGRKIESEQLPPSNLVFLVDVSGSMNRPDRLPLLQESLRMLVRNLNPRDRVAIVVYAGAAGLVLPSTTGDHADQILAAIDKMQAGGSTAGGAGILLAYKTAQENFIRGGNNRVILASDGDFNVGVSDQAGLVSLIEEKRKEGVFLTVLGFGRGNLQDAKMEQLADHGNGHYAYIDTKMEAQKVMVTEMGATLFTIAKDVKIQVEFNPALVSSYRLIGYENRMLRAEDFDNDAKDAGELGAGHSVTALYEIVPSSAPALPGFDHPDLDRETAMRDGFQPVTFKRDQLLAVKLRYKAPDSETSRLIIGPAITSERPIERASENLRFAAAVAGWGMILQDSKLRGQFGYDDILALARGAMGHDLLGYRKEFVALVEKSKGM
jgi:Ca-activated chloride channel family protein